MFSCYLTWGVNQGDLLQQPVLALRRLKLGQEAVAKHGQPLVGLVGLRQDARCGWGFGMGSGAV